MKIPDLNLLVYAVDRESPEHDRALAWWNGVLSGSETVGLAWSVLLGFVRLTTKTALFPSPLSVEDAMEQVEQWLAAPAAVILEPTTNHVRILRQLLEGAGTGGNLVSDAHLAALAIEHRADVVSFDRDFARFPGVRCELPLRSA